MDTPEPQASSYTDPVTKYTAPSSDSAFVYNMDQYKREEEFYQQALLIREEELGPTHPNIVGYLNELAGLYLAQDKHIEAIFLYKRALAIQEEQLGPTHPEIVSSLNSLAELYKMQDKHTEMEELYARILAIQESTNTIPAPTILRMKNDIWSAYQP
jgi:tetratricopeptide (TPR) repeat protein